MNLLIGKDSRPSSSIFWPKIFFLHPLEVGRIDFPLLPLPHMPEAMNTYFTFSDFWLILLLDVSLTQCKVQISFFLTITSVLILFSEANVSLLCRLVIILRNYLLILYLVKYMSFLQILF